jgi:hypothetical protein
LIGGNKPMGVKKGEIVRTIKNIVGREAFYKGSDKPGSTTINVNAGKELVAVTDELGGNVFVEAKNADGEWVYFALAQGEWEPAS